MNCKKFFIWFNPTHTSFYIDWIDETIGSFLLNERIVIVNHVTPIDSSIIGISTFEPQLGVSIYHELIGFTFNDFLQLPPNSPLKNIVEFEFTLSSGKMVQNFGSGIKIDNVDSLFIIEILSNISSVPIQITNLEGNRFYVIKNNIISTTQHFCDEPIEYICSLCIPEIFDKYTQ